jgi:hypothetical protein
MWSCLTLKQVSGQVTALNLSSSSIGDSGAIGIGQGLRYLGYERVLIGIVGFCLFWVCLNVYIGSTRVALDRFVCLSLPIH